MTIHNEIIEKYDYLPYTAEDDICQHKGEPNHRHTKYNGKEYLPYAEWKENREVRIKKLILTEAYAEVIDKIVKELGLYDKLEAIVHISAKDIRYKMFDRYRKELIKNLKVD